MSFLFCEIVLEVKWKKMTEGRNEIRKEYGQAVKYQRALEALESFDTKSAWNETIDRLQQRRQKYRFLVSLQRIAAVLFLPLLCATIILGYINLCKENDALSASWIETYVPVGCRSKIVLSDSSVVWLNSGIKLSYPNRFMGTSREVKLNGEAYFQVHSDKVHPFYVILSNGVQVMAHGTQFNISNYKDDPSIDMTLITGAIDVICDSKRITALKPHGQCVYNKAGGTFAHHLINPQDYTSWKEERLVFRDTSLDVVLRLLSHRFGVKFQVFNRHSVDYRVRAIFEKEDLNEILKSLQMIVPFKWKVQKEYTLNHQKVIDVYVN